MSTNLSEIESWIQEANSEQTPPDRLTLLARIDDELARLVAKNPAAPPHLLADLSDSYDAVTRQNVASNPNTPTAVLFELGCEFPEELLSNPIFTLLQLENPNLVSQIPTATLASLYKSPNVPDSFIEWGIKQGNGELYLALTMNPKLSHSLLEKLLYCKDFWATEATVLHINYSRGKLSYGEEDAIQSVWSIYWGDEDYRDSLRQLKWFEPIYQKIAPILFKNNSSLLDSLVSYGEDLAADPNLEERLTLAKSPDTTRETLVELAFDRNIWIRRNVAKNPKTPPEILELLAYDRDTFVRENVAASRTANEKTLQQLSQDSMASIRQRVAKNPKTPPDVLRQLAIAGDRTICNRVAINPNTPASVLENFYREKDYSFYLARNPNTPVAILTELAQSQDRLIREGTARNPRTPNFMLKRLALDGQDTIRQALAQNPQIPEALSIKLLSDRSKRVLQFATVRYLADYPDGLSVVLQHYPQSCTQDFSFFILLLHPDIPSDLLIEHSRSSAWRIRYAIASHAKTPLDILCHLTHDANRIVRSAAIATLRRDESVVKTLSPLKSITI